MRLRLICVGKTRNPHLRALCEDYAERLKRFARLEISEVREANTSDAREGSALEGSRIIAALRESDAPRILLDVTGVSYNSHEWAGQLDRWQLGGVKAATFIIGGAFGVTADVRQATEQQWSLSPLTFTHEMARMLLLEQLYRAYSILHGLPYQK